MSDTMKRTATAGARLRDVVYRMDAKGMTQWVEQVKGDCAGAIHADRYQSVFRCFDIENKDVLIGAAGRLAGMRIWVSRAKIVGELDLDGETVFSEEQAPEGGFDSVPFASVFALCSKLRSRLKELTDPEFYAVPFLGGVKSIILSDRPQEIVNYYLPEIELFGDGDAFRLFSAPHIPEQLPLAVEGPEEESAPCLIRSREEYPGKQDYAVRMEHVLDELKRDEVQKVVVARKCTVTPDENFSRCGYAAHLFDHYFQEYYFVFRQGEEDYWVGISPEIIMKQRGRSAVTKPLAGTRKKFDDEDLNAGILENLTSTNKDIVEHEHALYFMVDQLKRAGIGRVEIDKNKTVMETPYAFHIKSEISMRLNEDVTCFDIIGAIYPPATIWGIPVDKTEWILAQTEPFERGYYSGVYGYWNFEGVADTALVIRTAKVEKSSVSVYAGGGIVKYSDIDAEFDETVNKMRPLLSYFQDK